MIWIVQISVLVVLIPFGHRYLTLPALIKRFDRPASGTPGPRHDWRRLNRIIRGVLRRTLKQDYCLTYSLILFYFCRKWGYETRIFVGARKKESELDGHAWVLIDGHPVPGLTPPEGAYTPFIVYPDLPD